MKITLNNLTDVYKSKQCTPETMGLRGYEWITNLFVDSSGLGAEDEPALTQSQFMTELKKLITDNGGSVYTAISSAGQFQVNLGVYKKTGKSKLKRISGNTYELRDDEKLTIRLYDTDIVTIRGDSITLDSGGFNTVTTKKWINKYINKYGYYVYQKDFDWFVQSRIAEDTTTIPFTDGMVLQF